MRLPQWTAEGNFSVRTRTLVRRLDYDRTLPLDLVDVLLHGDPDQLLAESEPLQQKNRCTAARLDHPAGPLLIKRHEWGDWRRTTRMLLRAPTSRVSARLGLMLAQRGLPTPRPRASVECGLGPFGIRSYLLTDFVEGTTLHRYIRAGSGSPDLLADMARQVAGIWQQLIDWGISHNDLKPENFIVDQSSRIWVIDFERPRRHRNGTGLQQRHLADLARFLHVRSWRRQPAAAETFRRELLKTPLGNWLQTSQLAGRPGLCLPYSSNQLADRLSVVVMTGSASGPGSTATTETQVQTAIDSARDIADEILVVSPSSPGAWRVLRRIENPGRETAPSQVAPAGNHSYSQTGRPTHPWVLMLQSGDYVSPELARQLPEQIVERTDCDAFRIPIVESNRGRSVGAGTSPAQSPIRLFHQQRCSFSLRRGEITIAADPARIGQLIDKLHHERHLFAADAQSERRLGRAA